MMHIHLYLQHHLVRYVMITNTNETELHQSLCSLNPWEDGEK